MHTIHVANKEIVTILIPLPRRPRTDAGAGHPLTPGGRSPRRHPGPLPLPRPHRFYPWISFGVNNMVAPENRKVAVESDAPVENRGRFPTGAWKAGPTGHLPTLPTAPPPLYPYRLSFQKTPHNSGLLVSDLRSNRGSFTPRHTFPLSPTFPRQSTGLINPGNQPILSANYPKK